MFVCLCMCVCVCVCTCMCVCVCVCVCVCESHTLHINVGNLHLLIQQLSCARLPLNPETFLDKNRNVLDSITLDKPSHKAYASLPNHQASPHWACVFAVPVTGDVLHYAQFLGLHSLSLYFLMLSTDTGRSSQYRS